MKAVVMRQFGEANQLRVETLADPKAGPGEVILRVRACGVCYHDIICRRGGIPNTQMPAVLGHEVAGEVVEVGPGVEGWKTGDRAATLQRLSCGECAYCKMGRTSLCKKDSRFFGEQLPGGYASYIRVPVRALGRVPAGLDWNVAATVCCTSGTAVHVLRTRGQVKAGQTVLITGASGGVGMQVLRLAKLDGARVIAVSSSDAKRESLEAAGADEVVVHKDLAFASEVRRRVGVDGVDLAIEIVGAKTFGQTLRTMAPGGRVVVVGNLDTAQVEINPGLVIVKELELVGAYATTQGELEEALGLVHSGKLGSKVSDVLPLEAAPSAHFRLENREVSGRLVLNPDLKN
jgi:D-arabinose 1-dehydrogenase-like Zn-dependent alcohol dehydrogenase